MAIVLKDRQEWLQNPVTIELLEVLGNTRQENMEDWAKEQFIGQNAEETLAANYTAIGGIRVLDQIIEHISGLGTEEEPETELHEEKEQ